MDSHWNQEAHRAEAEEEQQMRKEALEDNEAERYKQILRKYLTLECKISFEDRIKANLEFIEGTEFKTGFAKNKEVFEAGKEVAIEIHKIFLEAIEQHDVKGDMVFMDLEGL